MNFFLYIMGAVFLLWVGYIARIVHEEWIKTDKPMESATTPDWSEAYPSPQQIAFEQHQAWKRLQEHWQGMSEELH